jgi:hypothetical protein
MKIKRKILRGEPGTKKLIQKYGDSFLCVRYRYDEKNGKRYKTVEIIEEENEWKPDRNRIPANKIVQIKVAYGEVSLRRAIRSLGGKWNPEKKLWEIFYKDVVNLGLEDRMVYGENV